MIIFNGPFKEVAPLYIEYKKSLGYKCKSEQESLKRMDTFFLEKGVTDVKLEEEIVEEFIRKKENESYNTQAKRISLVKQFAVFLLKLNYQNIHLTKIQPQNKQSKFKPHIYTKSQIEKIFNYVDNIDTNFIYDDVLPLLIRMAYSCGMRKEEMLSLKVKNLDLTQNIITIYCSKGNVSRIIPMHESLTKSCSKYIELNNKDGEDFLFSKKDGTKCSKHITDCLQRVLKKINVFKEDGSIPRLHDFRFTFAVNTLSKLDKDGYDLYTTLPLLSTYLGHKNVTATEYYLMLVKEYYADIIDKENKFYKNFFPDIES